MNPTAGPTLQLNEMNAKQFREYLETLQPQIGSFGGRYYAPAAGVGPEIGMNDLLEEFEQLTFQEPRNLDDLQAIHLRLHALNNDYIQNQHTLSVATRTIEGMAEIIFKSKHEETREAFLDRIGRKLINEMAAHQAESAAGAPMTFTASVVAPLPAAAVPLPSSLPSIQALKLEPGRATVKRQKRDPSGTASSPMEVDTTNPSPGAAASAQAPDPKAMSRTWRAQYRALLLPTEGMLPREEQCKLRDTMRDLELAANVLGTPLDKDYLKRKEHTDYLCRIFGTRTVLCQEGELFAVMDTPKIRHSLDANRIAYGPSKIRGQLAINSDASIETWCSSVVKLRDTEFKLNKKFSECFTDETGSWGVSLQQTEPGEYRFQIGVPSLRKTYALFALLKELKFVDWNAVFDVDSELPPIRTYELQRMYQYFERQREFKEQFPAMFDVLDPQVQICTGNEPVSNFYVTSLGFPEDKFRSDLKIERRAVDLIRQEGGLVIYPAAVQVQTKSDELMNLLESYFKDFRFADRKGNPKTFIIETKAPGQVHKSNLSEEHFQKLTFRINRLKAILRERGTRVQQAMYDVLGTKVAQPQPAIAHGTHAAVSSPTPAAARRPSVAVTTPRQHAQVLPTAPAAAIGTGPSALATLPQAAAAAPVIAVQAPRVDIRALAATWRECYRRVSFPEMTMLSSVEKNAEEEKMRGFEQTALAANEPLDIAALKCQVQLDFLRRSFRGLEIANSGRSGCVLTPTDEVVTCLRKHQIAFTTRPTNEMDISSGVELDKWCSCIMKSRDVYYKLNAKFRDCFKDDVEDWGVSLEEIAPEQYRFNIQKPSLRKTYALFALLKELKILSADTVFETTTKLPVIQGVALARVYAYFEKQQQFKAQFVEVFNVLDPECEICTGSEPVSNFYVTSLGFSPEAFREKLKIDRNAVDQIRREGGAVVYPAAVQVRTRSDDLMNLLEMYYKEYGFQDRKGNAKTFVVESRGPGQVHFSNLPEDQFQQLNSRLNRLKFIQRKCDIGIENAIYWECRQELVTRFAQARIERLTEMMCTAGLPDRTMDELLEKFETLKTSKTYAELEAKEAEVWKEFERENTSIGPKSKEAPRRDDIERRVIDRVLYADPARPSAALVVPQTPLSRLERQCEVLRGAQLFQAAIQESGTDEFQTNLDSFCTVARDKLRGDPRLESPVMRAAFDMWEQIVYKIKQGNLLPQRYEQFFLQLRRIDWRGCGEGFTTKIQELQLILGADQGVTDTLWRARNNLVTEFVDINYANDREIVMYLSGIKTALNDELGLGLTQETLSHNHWGQERAEEAKRYVTSNFTPVLVSEAIYQHLKGRVVAALESGTVEDFNSIMTELGVSETERTKYYDYDTLTFDGASIQFDLPVLIMQYAIRHQYLTWGGGREIIDPDYNRETYAERVAEQRREEERAEAGRRAAESQQRQLQAERQRLTQEHAQAEAERRRQAALAEQQRRQWASYAYTPSAASYSYNGGG